MTKHPVQVRFVGSGDAFGSGGRFQACILLHAPGHDGDVLLDCGASSLVALKQQRQDPNQIGLVLVSHLHGDHFGGLPFLTLDGQFGHRTQPLHVAGPAGVGERVQAAMEVLFPGSTGVRRRFPVHFHELTDRQPRQFKPTGLVVVPYEVVHASGAPALRRLRGARAERNGAHGDLALLQRGRAAPAHACHPPGRAVAAAG